MSVLNHKCPSCNANLPFNPTTGKWDCEYCGVTYELEELKKIENKTIGNANNSNENLDVYTCIDCGARILTDENTSATFCVYCGNTSIIKDRLVEEFEPEKVIPFKINKEEAIKKYRDTINKKFLLPNKFKKDSVIEKITGIYIPFWLYDCSGSAKLGAVGEKIVTKIKRNNKTIETSIYELKRNADFEYERIPTDGLMKLDNKLMYSLEPYDYNQLEDFNTSYLSGFFAEKYDDAKKTTYEEAEKRIKNTIEAKMKNLFESEKKQTYYYNNIRNLEIDIKTSINKAEYVLLPVWILNIKFGSKYYLCAVNGQTGKCAGEFLKSKIKILSIFTLMFLIFSMIYYSLIIGISYNFIDFTRDIMPMSLIVLLFIPYILFCVSKARLKKIEKQLPTQRKYKGVKNSYYVYFEYKKWKKIYDTLLVLMPLKWICLVVFLLMYIVYLIDMDKL